MSVRLHSYQNAQYTRGLACTDKYTSIYTYTYTYTYTPETPCTLEAIHERHLHIHEDEVSLGSLVSLQYLQCSDTVVRDQHFGDAKFHEDLPRQLLMGSDDGERPVGESEGKLWANRLMLRGIVAGNSWWIGAAGSTVVVTWWLQRSGQQTRGGHLVTVVKWARD